MQTLRQIAQLVCESVVYAIGAMILVNILVRVSIRYMKQTTVVVGVAMFIGWMVYGFQTRRSVHLFDRLSKKVDEQLESLPSGADIHSVASGMTRMKNTVNYTVTPRMDTAVFKVVCVYRNVLGDTGYKPLITSANDYGGHKPNSAHYRGEAVDFRIKDLDYVTKTRIVDAVKTTLGSRFFVLHEDIGNANEHLHVQISRSSS
jgi:uncharacterized protein YcbK (DUF882 family)